jgi:hypothetical protein
VSVDVHAGLSPRAPGSEVALLVGSPAGDTQLTFQGVTFEGDLGDA